MKLTLTKETLVELTAGDMAAVVGGGDDSNSCSIASCITSGGFRAIAAINVDICDVNNA